MSKMPDEPKSAPARLDRTRPQMPKRQYETGQSKQASNQEDRVSLDDLIDEEGRSLSGESEVIAEERENTIVQAYFSGVWVSSISDD